MGSVAPFFQGARLGSQRAFTPQFGCRMAATISSGDGGLTQDSFQRKLYLEDLPSRTFVQRNTGRDGKRNPFNFEDLIHGIVIPNTDGHGFAAYKNGSLLKYYRSPSPMAEIQDGKMVVNSGYSKRVQQTLEQHPDVMIGHVRGKSGTSACLENTHPFKYKIGDDTWSLVHNGSGNAAKSVESTSLVQSELGFVTQENTTWTEVSFLNFMSRLNQERRKLQQADSKTELGNECIKRIFAETVSDLDNHSPVVNPLRSKTNPNQLGLVNPEIKFFNLHGAVQHAPSSTFITTNGKLTLAVSSQRVLHLGKVQYPNGEYDYVLASEIPADSPKNCNWLVLPPHHILSIEKLDDGQLKATIEPLAALDSRAN
jgi:predicted glutamine amidotransferase